MRKLRSLWKHLMHLLNCRSYHEIIYPYHGKLAVRCFNCGWTSNGIEPGNRPAPGYHYIWEKPDGREKLLRSSN